MSLSPQQEINRRRTFAIISHPDAGKTTITEKLLLFGGAIQMAGAVRGRRNDRSTTSDFLKVEQERGISVSSAVMSFDYKERAVNLLDTPGHEDFSEDTYRVLTAVDSALMVLDAAKGVETRTQALMDVCRLRTTPVVSFANKMDREALDPFELMRMLKRSSRLAVFHSLGRSGWVEPLRASMISGISELCFINLPSVVKRMLKSISKT